VTKRPTDEPRTEQRSLVVAPPRPRESLRLDPDHVEALRAYLSAETRRQFRGHIELIDRRALPGLIDRLENALSPASQRDVAELTALVVAGFPHLGGRSGTDLTLLGLQLAEDVAEYPPDILHEALRRHRRKDQFFAVATLRKTAIKLLRERKDQLAAAREMLRCYDDHEEHNREVEERQRRENGRGHRLRIAEQRRDIARLEEDRDHLQQQLARGRLEPEVRARVRLRFEGLEHEIRVRQDIVRRLERGEYVSEYECDRAVFDTAPKPG